MNIALDAGMALRRKLNKQTGLFLQYNKQTGLICVNLLRRDFDDMDISLATCDLISTVL